MLLFLLGLWGCSSAEKSEQQKTSVPNNGSNANAPIPPATIGKNNGPPPSANHHQRVSFSLAEKKITSLLSDEAKLQLEPMRGPFGRKRDVLFLLAEHKGELWALADNNKFSLGGTFDGVSDFFFDDVDQDGKNGVVILASFITGIGPEGTVPYQQNAILDFDTGMLVRLAKLEKEIATLTTTDEVRKMLKPLPPKQ